MFKMLYSQTHSSLNRNDIEINMTADVGGVDYNVTNGIANGTGSVNITTNLFPNASYYDISIKSNLSSDLFFNVTCNVKISDTF